MINEEKSLESGKIKGCTVKNMELIQDFAMVNNLFCDKTGTLTKNVLIFKCLTFGKDLIEVSNNDLKDYGEKIKNYKPEDEAKWLDFWRCICVCHDVSQVFLEADATGKKVETYQGASMDEVIFLEMAKASGHVRFVERDNDSITINVKGETEKYTILKQIEFTSSRKRMSLIVKRESDGKVYNFIKGADFAIVPRLNKGEEKKCKVTTDTLDEQANTGLRTLMFALKELPSESTAESLKNTPDE